MQFKAIAIKSAIKEIINKSVIKLAEMINKPPVTAMVTLTAMENNGGFDSRPSLQRATLSRPAIFRLPF